MDQQDQQEQFHYQVEQPNDDYKQAVILKTGLTAKFTLAQVEQHEANLVKSQKELSAQIEVDKAMMQNVIDFHAVVGTLSDEDLAGAAVYYEAKRRVAQNGDSLATITKQINEYSAEKVVIMKTLGFEPAVDPIISTNPPSNEQAPEGTQEG